MSGSDDVTIESRIIRQGREIGRMNYRITAVELRELSVGPTPLAGGLSAQAWAMKRRTARGLSSAIAEAVGIKVAEILIAAISPDPGNESP